MPNVDFENPMDFGMGVNSSQLKARGTGVTGIAPDSVSGGGGQTVRFSLKKIETYEDFQSAFAFARIVAVNVPGFRQAVVQQVNTKLANMGYPPNICTWATGPYS
jgi:hypothetical protein